ncbi:LOW QUALITY PROTEIN: uncharacterized protein C6orf136 homolog [Falco biarmicus]|uniref:LOW QUALITY PROTEIN: uncharacterized protein C6orf136 homolog n=1 Tax=Falco biarmicus TaxID=345155 RepID=UPI0024BC22BC|nr:LOW QUALITY PROTEIN: uncharacterized protein C6orf136 homolog [Falco biarmicus]
MRGRPVTFPRAPPARAPAAALGRPRACAARRGRGQRRSAADAQAQYRQRREGRKRGGLRHVPARPGRRRRRRAPPPRRPAPPLGPTGGRRGRAGPAAAPVPSAAAGPGAHPGPWLGTAPAAPPRHRCGTPRPGSPAAPRARALSPPEGLEGGITTVDGQREDDIAVRDGPATAAAVLLLLRPPISLPGPRRAPPPPPTQHGGALGRHAPEAAGRAPPFLLKIPDYSLYSPDVEFINHLLHLHTHGRPMYQVAVALCRAVAWAYFASLRLEVLALTRHSEDWSIRARWRLTGLPLHLCLLRFYRRDKRQLLRSYDAFSTFFLNSQGLIRCHRVDKLMPAPTAVTEAKKLLVAAAVAVALAEPGPALRLALKPSATSGDT